MRRMALVLVFLVGLHELTLASDEQPPAAGNAESVLFDAARALMRSEDARKRAWGAHLAGSLPRSRAEALRTALVRLLDAHAYSKDWDDQSVAAAAWDALIRLGMQVSADKLLTHLEHWPTQAVALLVRETDANRVQLRKALGTGLRGVDWMAVVAALSRGHDPGIADQLLWGLRLRLQVDVFPGEDTPAPLPDGVLQRYEARVVSAAGGRRGWPPFVDYGLTDAVVAGDEVLVSGRRPMFLRRAVSAADTAQRIRITPVTPPHRFRIHMLEGLTGGPPGFSRLTEERRLAVSWTTPEDYIAQVRRAWLEIKRLHGTLMTYLRRSGALTDANMMRQRLRLKVKGTWHGEGTMKLPEVPEPR